MKPTASASATMGDGADVTVVSVEEMPGYDDEPPPAATPAPAPVPAPAPASQKAASEQASGGGGKSGGGIFRILLLSFRSAEVICCLIAFR